MKTRTAPNFLLIVSLVAGLASSSLGCAAEDVQVTDVTTIVPLTATTNAVAPQSPPMPVPAPIAPSTNPAPITFNSTLQLPLPPLLDQVVRLGLSGADEPIISAYVEKAASPYQITGNDIIQLRALGVSPNVILALIEHSKSSETAPAPPAGLAPAAIDAAPETSPTATPLAASPIPETEAAADFYSSLAPYGSWQNLPDYGWCWQPTVVVVNPIWQPYCDAGSWLWSDNGWYWNSYYSWGWAPFHYGRWCNPGRGWLWCPDRIWGASWVSWRNSGSYCGWAPLPPGACYNSGAGWSYRGATVDASCGFGLGASHYTFVAHDRFTDRQLAAHAVRGEAATAAYRNTTVINNYAVGANNRVVNHGVARETIAAVSRSPIREVGVRELPAGTAAAVVPDRVTRVGNTTVVYRPGPQISVPHTTPALQQNQVNSTRSTTARTAASTPQSLLPRMAPRPPVPAGSTVSRPMANNTRNYASNRLLIPQPQNSFIAPVAPRSGSMIARPSTPAQSFARPANSSTSYARRSAPTTVTRSAPSGGGMAARGSTSQGSRTVSSSSVAHR